MYKKGSVLSIDSESTRNSGMLGVSHLKNMEHLVELIIFFPVGSSKNCNLNVKFADM